MKNCLKNIYFSKIVLKYTLKVKIYSKQAVKGEYDYKFLIF